MATSPASKAAIDGVTRAGACVAPLLRTLRRCGFSRLSPNESQASLSQRVGRKLHDAYCGFSLVATSAYLGQELIYAYQGNYHLYLQERHDMDRFSRVMFLLLCHVTSIAKQVVFLVRASRITALLEGLDGTAAVTCALWTLFPLLLRLHGGTVHFAFWMPLDYNATWLKFSVVLLYTHYVTTLVAVANTTMDAFIATVLGQCKTQLTILKMDFESLGERAAARARATGERSGAAAAALLVQCVSHHHKICHTSRELQAVFGGAVLLQFGIGGWILCMAAFKLVGMNVASLEFVSILMFLMCILTELFLYCYYGNEVAVESTQVSDAAYGMRWMGGEEGVGLRVRRALPFVLCCCAGAARRPLRPAALFIPLSLETFVTIIKSSYTFYAMLRQTQH